MIAYHGKPEVKELYLSRVRAHVAADELIKGKYWENGKGCAVGCTIHGSDHSRYETELGIPRLLAKLEDGIFEALLNGEAKQWPGRFLAAIQPGADLAQVWPQFAVWLLVDKHYGIIQFVRTDRSRNAVQNIADAYAGMEIDWRKLRAAAADAVAAAAAARSKWRIAQSEKLLELLASAPIATLEAA